MDLISYILVIMMSTEEDESSPCSSSPFDFMNENFFRSFFFHPCFSNEFSTGK